MNLISFCAHEFLWLNFGPDQLNRFGLGPSPVPETAPEVTRAHVRRSQIEFVRRRNLRTCICCVSVADECRVWARICTFPVNDERNGKEKERKEMAENANGKLCGCAGVGSRKRRDLLAYTELVDRRRYVSLLPLSLFMLRLGSLLR